MNYDYIKCGDCMQLLDELDCKVNLVITSPPYNMTPRAGGISDTGRYDVYSDWMSESEYLNWISNLFNKFDNVLINNGVVLFNFSYSVENPSLPYKLVNKIINDTNFDLVDTIVWKKNSSMPVPANPRRLNRIWEFVYVFCRKSEINTYLVNKKIVSVSEKTHQKYYSVIQNFITAKNNDGICKLNQATFSSELVEKLIDMYSCNIDDVILDPFMGTGTTAIGALNRNKHYIGFELSQAQVDYANERINFVNKSLF